MDKTVLRKVQLTQLEIAKEIKRVCDENDINYFLDSGTLIGAVRHKGFIPWDDDMDIGMLRSDYDKFVELAPEKLGEDFFLQTWDNDVNYPLAFAKVRKKNTKYIEAVACKSGAYNELYVDVFPYDVYPDDERVAIKTIKKVRLYKNILMMQCKYEPWARHQNRFVKILVGIKYFPYYILGKVKSKNKIKQQCNMYMKKFNNEKNIKWLYEQGGAQCGKVKLPIKCFETFTIMEFENENFKCPNDFDAVLTRMYGNYMELPPVEERENRHNIIKIEL